MKIEEDKYGENKILICWLVWCEQVKIDQINDKHKSEYLLEWMACSKIRSAPNQHHLHFGARVWQDELINEWMNESSFLYGFNQISKYICLSFSTGIQHCYCIISEGVVLILISPYLAKELSSIKITIGLLIQRFF